MKFIQLFSFLRKISSSQTARDTYWIFGGNVITSFLAFIYTIFLARGLNPSNLGIFSAVLAFILLFIDICDLGIGSSLSRFLPSFISKGESKEAASFTKTAFIFQLKVALSVSVAIILFSPFLSQIFLRSRNLFSLFIVSGIGIFGSIILSFLTSLLSAQKRFREVAIVNILSTVSKAFLIISFFFLSLLNIQSAIIVFAISSYLAFFLLMRFFNFSFLKEKEEKGNLKKLLTFSLFLAFSRLFSAIGSRLDALMLIPLSSSYEAGIYSGAYKITSVYVLLAASFSAVIAPRLSGFRSMSETIIYLKKVILVVLGILLSIVALFFIASWFVVLILGKNYILSIPVFQALLLPMAFFTATIVPVNFLIYVVKKPQISTLNTFVQLVILFFGNLYLIPKYGRFGPVVTLSLVYGFTFISASFFAFYFYQKKKDE
jgi:O-antigen/teichoic acid export membrane protein